MDKKQGTVIAVTLPFLTEAEIPLIHAIRETLGRWRGGEVIVLSGGYEGPLRRLAESGQLAGAIGEFMGSRWVKELLAMGIPVVQIGYGTTATPSVETDIPVMARESVRAFLRGGMKAAGFLGASGPPDSMQLGESFEATCREKGVPVHHCHAINGTVLKSFLRALPRPAGILCASDRLARATILAAREAGMGIPDDLAVIGVGNSRMESLHAGMTISSFELPLGEIGRRAGSAMADLLFGTPSSQSWQTTPVSPVLHERESSMRAASPLDRLLAHLRSHPDTPMSAGELARFAGMSRRSFEIAVRDCCGCSPGELLRRMRRDRAEKLLRDTDLGIAAIGRECGYPEAAVFSTAFRRWTGKSPREFRGQPRSQKLA